MRVYVAGPCSEFLGPGKPGLGAYFSPRYFDFTSYFSKKIEVFCKFVVLIRETHVDVI